MAGHLCGVLRYAILIYSVFIHVLFFWMASYLRGVLYSVFIHLLLFWTAKSWWRDRGRRRDASTSTAINRLDHDLDYHDLLDHGRENPRARPLPPQPRLRRHLGDHVFLVGRTSHVVHTDEKCRHLKNCTYTTLQTCKHCDQLVR